jgi:riboflavin synthase
MFTGIIETIGAVKGIKKDGDSFLFEISHPWGANFEIGESVALSGMCTTVVAMTDEAFVVEVMEESRNKTLFGSIEKNSAVNLERSAVIGQRNSGHHVTGHVDTVGTVKSIVREADFWRVKIGFDVKHRNLVVEKGSICIDGISLTVCNVGDNWFDVCIIDHTWKMTTLGQKKEKDGVNLEFDLFGKYVLRSRK